MVNSSKDAVLQNPRIPTLPMVALKVLQLTREPNINLTELAQAIQNDQALAVKIVRTVNSSYYGLARPCASLNQAIVYLGVNAIKALVLGFSLVESIDGKGERDVGFDYADYWRRTLYNAAAAKEIATIQTAFPREACDPEEAFLAALVQDVGMIALYRTYRDVYLQIVDMTSGDHNRLVELERRSLQIDHAAVAAALLERWRFAPQLVEAVQHHHGSDTAGGESGALAHCSRLAARLTSAAAVGEMPIGVHETAERQFGVDSNAVAGLLERIGQTVPDLARLFNVDAGDLPAGRFDSEQVMAAAEDLRVEHEVTMVRAFEQFKENGQTGKPGGAVADRSALHHHLESGLKQAVATGPHFALVLLAVDGISQIEQAIGPDEAMKLRKRIHDYIGETAAMESIFELGPAKVAFTLAQSDRRDAARKIEPLRKKLSEAISTLLKDQTASVSIGVATSESALEMNARSAAALMQIAERAQAAAAQAGGNCVRIFSPEPREKAAA